MSEEAYKEYPHHLENRPDLTWVGEMKDRVICKVSFYNSCGLFKKILFSIVHGRSFVPNEKEIRLSYLFKQREKEIQENKK